MDLRLPQAPGAFGAYVEAVQTGNLLFLSGMMAVENQRAKYSARIGKEVNEGEAQDAARIAGLNGLGIAREYLGSLDKVSRVVRVGVYMATSGENIDEPRVADGASVLFRDIFGADKMSCRLVIGVASLPLGAPIQLEVIFEVGT